MKLSRRSFLHASLTAPVLAAGRKPRFKLGVTDWNLRLAGKVEAVELAKKLGFEGVEVSLGRKVEGGKLPMDDAERQAQHLAAAKEQGIAIAGTCLDALHVNYLKSDPLGSKWIAAGVPITRKLNARVMLLPFFGKGALTTRDEMDYVGDALKELGPEAVKAGVFLGLEDTISAEDNVRIMKRSGSPAVKVYYDVGNSTSNGFDPLKEIPWLGKSRICQIHLKDNPGYMGEGKINFPAVLDAIAGIGFDGFANLETSSPSKDVEADMRRNATYIRKLMS